MTGVYHQPGSPTRRNRYFTGKYMTARDFRDEQAYFLSRQRLHQRTLHGWGIVVGLDLCPHPDPGCAWRGWIVVTPGIAVDCYGREIVLHDPVPVKLDALFPDDVDCGCEKENGSWSNKLKGLWPHNGPGTNREFLVGVRYGELGVEPVPVLCDDTACGERPRRGTGFSNAPASGTASSRRATVAGDRRTLRCPPIPRYRPPILATAWRRPTISHCPRVRAVTRVSYPSACSHLSAGGRQRQSRSRRKTTPGEGTCSARFIRTRSLISAR